LIHLRNSSSAENASGQSKALSWCGCASVIAINSG
jgi:hypothetical protein